MRTIILPQTQRAQSTLSISSGPGAPIFQSGTQTRIYRAPVRAVGVVTCGVRESWGQVLDISPGGCLFKTDDQLEVGAEVELRVTIIGDERRAIAEINGIVRRSIEEGTRNAFGIEFVAADSDERRVLQWLYSQALR